MVAARARAKKAGGGTPTTIKNKVRLIPDTIAGADDVFDRATEIDEFTTYAINEVKRMAGKTQY